MSSIAEIQSSLQPLRKILLEHPLYNALSDLEDIQIFQQNHVFAVWDFMSLLKGLQKEINAVATPWIPKYPADLRRLINEIVLEEETDVNLKGEYASHYELYLEAMQEAGADTSMIQHFVDKVAANTSQLNYHVNQLPIPLSNFLKFTFGTIYTEELHRIASAFTFGREELIPDMFKELVKDVEQRHPGKLTNYVYYLDRHIELDDGVHEPLAFKMIEMLCKDDDKKWNEVAETARVALKQRIALWDYIYKEVNKKTKMVSLP